MTHAAHPFYVMIALDPHGWAIMTRDMELIRKILLQIQARKTVDLAPIEMPEVSDAILYRHIELLKNAGLIDAIIHRSGGEADHALVRDMTWEGHDLIAALENDSIWAKIKQSLSPNELATVPIAIIKNLGLKFLEAYLMNKAGF